MSAAMRRWAAGRSRSMKNLLFLALLILVAYYVYTSGILSRAVQTQPGSDATPGISVTVYSPFGSGAKTATLPPAATPSATKINVGAVASPAAGVTALPAAPTTALPAGTDAPTAIPVTLTPPPPTIVVPPPAPTLAIADTPTPSSAFTVTLETPSDGETTRFSPALVIGQTAPQAIVSVNDVVGIANADGRFSLSVPLQEGPNVLEVIASDAAGEQVYVILTVLYQP